MMGRGNVHADWNVSNMAGADNVEWDSQTKETLRMVLGDPSYENIRECYAILMSKYNQYYAAMNLIDEDDTREIKKKLDFVYKWLYEAHKYSVDIVPKKIIPMLSEIDREIETLVQEMGYKFKISGRRNKGLKANIKKMMDDLKKKGGDVEEEDDEE